MSFEGLPSELQLMVMSYFDPPTLYAMAQVNTAWNAYAVDQLWAHPPEKGRRHGSQIETSSPCKQSPKTIPAGKRT